MEYSNLRDEIAAIRQKLKSSEKYKYSTVHDELEALRQVIDSGSGGGGAGLESITYAELKAKRDNGELTPGGQYRITDYVCTTTQEETRAVSHPFDIIVVADDESTLNENARACQREGDTYYDNTDTGVMTTVFDGNVTIGEDGGDFYANTPISIDWPTSYEEIEIAIKGLRVTYDGTEYLLPLFDVFLGYGEFSPDGGPVFDNFPVFVHTDYSSIDTPRDTAGTQHSIKIEGVFVYRPRQAKLESWELKYCIDNDTRRFAWADETNGKGVIYYMKDANNNECAYDFKQIQFMRYRITQSSMADLIGEYTTAPNLNASITAIDTENPVWCYTFCGDNGETDASVVWNIYDNIIKKTFGEADGYNATILGNNVFFADHFVDAGINCSNNVLEMGCYCNTFGENCSGNVLGEACFRNTFALSCFKNIIGNECKDNVVGPRCTRNKVGEHCLRFTLGPNGWDNTFDAESSAITLGKFCSMNTFGAECNEITFGKFCKNNSVGNGCAKIELVEGTQFNTKRNYHILDGVIPKLAIFRITGTTGNDYVTYVGKDSSGIIKTWIPSDLSIAINLNEFSGMTAQEKCNLFDRCIRALDSGVQVRATAWGSSSIAVSYAYNETDGVISSGTIDFVSVGSINSSSSAFVNIASVKKDNGDVIHSIAGMTLGS